MLSICEYDKKDLAILNSKWTISLDYFSQPNPIASNLSKLNFLCVEWVTMAAEDIGKQQTDKSMSIGLRRN